MTSLLVDTDVFSFIFKKDTRAGLYIKHIENRTLHLSFMTVAELDLWALKANWGQKRKDLLEAYLHHFVIVPFTRSLSRQWAEVKFAMSKAGKPLDDSDARIAATALLYDIPIVTHNRKDFEGVEGLAVISEG